MKWLRRHFPDLPVSATDEASLATELDLITARPPS